MSDQNLTAKDVASRGVCPVTGHSTNQNGSPVYTEEHSATVGDQGPIALHDIHLVEKHAHFNRERIPERNVHAKGSGAFGELIITEDVSQYTKADLFQQGRVTPMLARFSTVAGEQGFPDTVRDVRGFSLKFYTQEGNYDIVGNNTPVFFLRDGMKFPDFIRSQKRLADQGTRSADMQWDFWTRSPETAHQVTYLMGDRGIPKNFRHMDGFSSHTYQWINAAGERFWVKYHFKSRQGWEFYTDEEAGQILAGGNFDEARTDLYEAIERGDYPVWDVKVQIMPIAEAANYRWNPFDLTKTWSQKDYPLIPVGHFTLNENPQNFFAQIEQAAFAPSNLVPGVGFSPDKMLLARVFAYADTQRYRLGVNHHQLPSNRPIVEQKNSYAKDGAATYEFPPAGTPVYSPNRHGRADGINDVSDGSGVVEKGVDAGQSKYGFGRGQESATGLAADLGLFDDNYGGDLTRGAYVRHPEDDDFIQAGILVREVLDDAARERLAGNIARAMDGVSDQVEQQCWTYWGRVDENLCKRVQELYEETKNPQLTGS
ncbi:catalase [Corynebacterium heidelbergense]|uniref:Catalase n=1 Tax=Corynebacterium heidelbergense TaxID=2055947 RepID=A0A364VB51_9CORY|nr:catalase [Corynebacterium heidelbergense]RAV33828.1 catalase [Corynebacterium heidelbergense]WCZ37499.1 Catalase [Corynebacterium heidelbergense]